MDDPVGGVGASRSSCRRRRMVPVRSAAAGVPERSQSRRGPGGLSPRRRSSGGCVYETASARRRRTGCRPRSSRWPQRRSSRAAAPARWECPQAPEVRALIDVVLNRGGGPEPPPELVSATTTTTITPAASSPPRPQACSWRRRATSACSRRGAELGRQLARFRICRKRRANVLADQDATILPKYMWASQV